MAAAKCRNRRRELTDTLQNVSECDTNERSTSDSKHLLTCVFLSPCRRLTSWRMKSRAYRRK